MNLLETGPVSNFNTGDPATTPLGLARQEKLAVLVNRPLNAFTGRGLLRLAELAAAANARTAALTAAIDPLLPADRRAATLSQKALWTVASTLGVTAVLNGMRSPDYVDDALGVLGWADLERVDRVYQAVRGPGAG